LSLNIQSCEDLWLKIESKNTKIISAVIYRHPSKEILMFQDKLCEILSDLNYLSENNENLSII